HGPIAFVVAHEHVEAGAQQARTYCRSEVVAKLPQRSPVTRGDGRDDRGFVEGVVEKLATAVGTGAGFGRAQLVEACIDARHEAFDGGGRRSHGGAGKKQQGNKGPQPQHVTSPRLTGRKRLRGKGTRPACWA